MLPYKKTLLIGVSQVAVPCATPFPHRDPTPWAKPSCPVTDGCYQLRTPAAWLATQLHSPAALVQAISFSTGLGLDFRALTHLLLLINVIVEHACKQLGSTWMIS